MNLNTSKSPRQQPDPEISIKALDQAFPALDANRATGYAQLGQARSAKSASLAREQKLLALKYGTAAAAHPRMQYAAAALTKNELLRREVAAIGEVLEATAPTVDPNSFVVYGFVRRKNQTGIPGLTLALTDESGNWLRQYGYTCTDQRGYFELRITRSTNEKSADSTQPAKTEEELKKEAALKKEQERAAAAGKPTEESTAGTQPAGLSTGLRINTNQSAASARVVQLRVFNRDGRVLHTEARPVVAKPDTIDYRLIILGDEDCGCTPPPEKSDGKNNPTAPSAPSAPPPAPIQPVTAPSAEPRVGGLKSYQNPVTPPAQSGQPLEAIRGIGPKTATKLRSTGIADVSAFEKTPGAALVKVAGFDKNLPKPQAPKAATTKPVETQPVEKTPAPVAKPTRIPAKPAVAKPAVKKLGSKKSAPAKKKRPQK